MPRGRSSFNTPMSYDSFRPKFPLDPFAAADNVPSTRRPWALDTDALPALHLLQSERRVIFAFGMPSAAALEPLFHSPQLTSSLLIIASHRPPSVPPNTRPAVHVLRLRSPIAVEDAGATRLVEVLEWAVQVARLWRRTNGPHNQELLEEASESGNGSAKPAHSSGQLRYSIAPPVSHLAPHSHLASSTVSLATNASGSNRSQSKRSSRLLRQQTGISTTPVDPEQKPLDVILHFLPADISDKLLLKAAILVTTLTRPYLSTAPVRAPATRFWSEGAKIPTSGGPPDAQKSKRWSLFRGTGSAMSSSTTVNAESGQNKNHRPDSLAFRSTSSNLSQESSRTMVSALARSRKSRLVHLMPSVPAKASQFDAKTTGAQARLIRSVEAFLLSFSFPLLSPNDSDLTRARPYLLPSSALADMLQLGPTSPADSEDGATQSEWSLAELILSGALERDDPAAGGGRISFEGRPGKQKEAEAFGAWDWMANRAWISGLSDILILSKTDNQQIPTTRTQIRDAEPPPPEYPEVPVRTPKSVPLNEKRLPTPPEESPARSTVNLPPANGSASPRSNSFKPQQLVPKSKRIQAAERPSSSVRRSTSRSRASSSAASPKLARRSSRTATTYAHVHGLPTPPDSEEALPELIPGRGRAREQDRIRERERGREREKDGEVRRIHVHVHADPVRSRSGLAPRDRDRGHVHDALRYAKPEVFPAGAPGVVSVADASGAAPRLPAGADAGRPQDLRHEKRHIDVREVDRDLEQQQQQRRVLVRSGSERGHGLGISRKRSRWKFWE